VKPALLDEHQAPGVEAARKPSPEPPDLLVALPFRFQRSIPPGCEFGVQTAREETRLLEEDVPHNSSVTSLTFLVETPSRYMCIKAKTSAFSFLW
jgi:hypothetical protein